MESLAGTICRLAGVNPAQLEAKDGGVAGAGADSV